MEITNDWKNTPYHCSKCHKNLYFVDGDNLQAIRASFDDFKRILSFDTGLHFLKCDQCGKEFLLVFLSVIEAANLSSDWVNKYFRGNEHQEEEENFITIDWKRNLENFPSALPASVTELQEGRLFRFWLGPLMLGTTGPNHEKFFEWVDLTLSLFVAENLAFRPLPEITEQP